MSAVRAGAPPARGWRRLLGWPLFAAFTAVLIPGLWLALRSQDWTVLAAVTQRGDPGRIGLLLAGALLVTTIGPVLGMLSWRAIVTDLGVPLTTPQAVRLFCIGFLSKYVPVKGLALVVAARLARSSGMSLGRFFGSGTLSLGVTVLTGLAVGLLAAVELFGAGAGWLALALAPMALLVFRPGLINWSGELAMRVLRRPPPEGAVSARGMRRAVALQSLAWLVSGVHLWLLALAMDAPAARSLLLCVGAFGLATVVGLLVVVVPDGIGVRESILMAALAAVLPVPAAAVVVLASRLVTTVSEVGLGALALLGAEVAHRRSTRRPDHEGDGQPCQN